MNDYLPITAEEAEATLNEITAFAAQDNFQLLVAQMRALPRDERPRFVKDVVINKEALGRRGIVVPEGIVVQRSVFGDGRPTLFCISKYLSDRKRKVTITIDDYLEEAAASTWPSAEPHGVLSSGDF